MIKNTPSEASTYLCSKIDNDQAKNSTGISVDRISPVGRLKDRVHVWDQLQVDIYIRDVIVNGYKLPFKELPLSVFLNNNRSARENPEFVDSEIQSLLKLKCISEVSQTPYVVNPLMWLMESPGNQG